LTQPAYRKANSNKKIYLSIASQLLDFAEREGDAGDRCDLTGIPTTLDFHAICAKALSEAGLPVPEKKWLGRDWIPLGGSLGNDAQALPVASRPLHVSALALFALQYLPLGVFLFKGKLACLQATQDELSMAWTADILEKNRERLGLETTDILGKGAGTGAAFDLLLRCFDDVSFAPGTEAQLWLFSNSGTGADCQTEIIPDSTLGFVARARERFGTEIRKLIQSEPKDSRLQLFECIRGERDYPGLYAIKSNPGVSAELYEFYQQEINGATDAALAAARKVAQFVLSAADKKELKEIRKPEFLRSATGRNRVRKAIIEHLMPEEYDALFPSERHPIRTGAAGWNFLRYYLTTQKEDKRPITTAAPVMRTTHPKIVQIAETYRNVDPRKIKNLLDRMMQRKIGVRWLQDKFCQLAKEHPEWEFGDWDEFVCDEDGKAIVFELLFQIRLYLSNLYREVTANSKGEAA
jgi:hypothetical protein